MNDDDLSMPPPCPVEISDASPNNARVSAVYDSSNGVDDKNPAMLSRGGTAAKERDSDAPAQDHRPIDDDDVDEMEVEEVRNDEDDDDDDDDEPDWDAVAQHEPAKTDAPIFLAARDRRAAANERFAAVLDEIHASLRHSVDEILKTAADMHNEQRERLDDYEIELKRDFIENEAARDVMHKKLEESATAAQGLFAQLLMRVSQPLASAGDQVHGMLSRMQDLAKQLENTPRPSSASASEKRSSKRKRSANGSAAPARR